MISIKLSGVDAHPGEIFQALENRKAEIEWAQKNEQTPLPEYQKSKIEEHKPGWINFFIVMLQELRP